MDKEEAQKLIDEFNDIALFGASCEEFEKIIHVLAEDGYGIEWDADKTMYTLTETPDLSVVE